MPKQKVGNQYGTVIRVARPTHRLICMQAAAEDISLKELTEELIEIGFRYRNKK